MESDFTGFPSPASDYTEGRLELAQLIKHPNATFFARAAGDEMAAAGIHAGDVLAIDRAVDVCDGDLIIARLGEELRLRRLHIIHGQVSLHTGNPQDKPLLITAETDFEVWGRVVLIVHQT